MVRSSWIGFSCFVFPFVIGSFIIALARTFVQMCSAHSTIRDIREFYCTKDSFFSLEIHWASLNGDDDDDQSLWLRVFGRIGRWSEPKMRKTRNRMQQRPNTYKNLFKLERSKNQKRIPAFCFWKIMYEYGNTAIGSTIRSVDQTNEQTNCFVRRWDLVYECRV